jgi:hypothetical protein
MLPPGGGHRSAVRLLVARKQYLCCRNSTCPGKTSQIKLAYGSPDRTKIRNSNWSESRSPLIPKHAFPADRDATNMFQTTPRGCCNIYKREHHNGNANSAIANRRAINRLAEALANKLACEKAVANDIWPGQRTYNHLIYKCFRRCQFLLERERVFRLLS